MKSTATRFVFAAVISVAATYTQAATLNAGDKLSIDSGVFTHTRDGFSYLSGGSWVMIDFNDDRLIQNGGSSGYDGHLPGEVVTLSQELYGIVIGASNKVLGTILQPAQTGIQTGYHVATTAITGGTSGLDLSGWQGHFDTNNYGRLTSADFGARAWTPLNAVRVGMAAGPYTDGIAKFNWSGVYGASYTLDYTASTPSGLYDDGFQYAVHLTGIVSAVPEASTYGMMLAGLGLVGAMARRIKQAEILS